MPMCGGIIQHVKKPKLEYIILDNIGAGIINIAKAKIITSINTKTGGA